MPVHLSNVFLDHIGESRLGCAVRVTNISKKE